MWKRLAAAYRWKKILASCRLDPASMPNPLPSPGPRDFIIAGCPRTGTSLVAAVLHQAPEIVTVMEPWDGLRMEPAELFASLRDEIVDSGRISRGRLDLDALREGVVSWQRDGEATFDLEVADGFVLGVKWPTMWQYLDLLPETKFVITLREPVEVITSFERVGGRLSQGLEYDVRFNAAINEELSVATSDRAVRQALLYQTINSRILPHLGRENVFTVRYERWFEDPDRLLAELSGFLDAPLTRSNVDIRLPPDNERPAPVVELVQQHVPVARELGYDV